jgi:magnesium transporter
VLTISSITNGKLETLPVEQCAGLRDSHGGDVLWLHAVGDGPDVTTALSDFGIEPWIVEDMLETSTHPKAEAWPGALFLVVFGVDLVAEEDRFELRTAEVDAVVGDGWVVTHVSRPMDLFDRATEIIERDPREAASAPELLHLLLDALVDQYEPFIDDFFPDRLDLIEDRLFNGSADPLIRQEIYLRRRDLQRLNRVAAPQVAAVRRVATLAEAANAGHPHLFVDIADRLAYVAGQIDALRGQLNAAFDHYQSLVAQTQNEIMKVLTMVSATLLPITVIAGIYGMNFRYMPELDQRWGYPAALALCVLIVVGSLVYFYAKGWLGRTDGAQLGRKLQIKPGVLLKTPAMGARGIASGTKRLVRWGLSR